MLPYVIAGLALGALYALSGVGLVLLYRATGVLNLAYGAVGALCALVGWELNQSRGLPLELGILITILLTVTANVLYGVLVAPLMAHRSAVVQATGTLGLALACLGIANWYWTDKARALRLPTDALRFEVLGVVISSTQVLAVLLVLVVAAVATWLLRVTRWGTNMRALAADRELTSLLGVSVRKIEALAWGLSGILAGVSAVLLASLTLFSAGWLTFLVIPALAAALVGRLRSLWGTVAGGITIGLAESLLAPVPALAQFRSVAPFVIAIAVTVWHARKRAYEMRASA